jgi:hypothetical protein
MGDVPANRNRTMSARDRDYRRFFARGWKAFQMRHSQRTEDDHRITESTMNARNTLRFFALLAATLVSACGDGGHTATVHQLAPSITYPSTSGFVVGTGITPLVPVITGSLSGFTVEPQ